MSKVTREMFRNVASKCYAANYFGAAVEEGSIFTETGKVCGRKVRALLSFKSEDNVKPQDRRIPGMDHSGKRYTMLEILCGLEGVPVNGEDKFNAKTDPRMGVWAEWLEEVLREAYPSLMWDAPRAAAGNVRKEVPADLLASLPGIG